MLCQYVQTRILEKIPRAAIDNLTNIQIAQKFGFLLEVVFFLSKIVFLVFNIKNKLIHMLYM